MTERRALLVSVSGFTEPDDSALQDLDYAADIEELAQVLQDSFGYSVTSLTEPGLTSAELGRVVQHALDSAGPDVIMIVHLLTHGVARDDHLYALGSDASVIASTEIGHWLADLQHSEGQPLVLFTLDLCNSGVVAQLPWLTKYDSDERRGWVIAACEPDADAFNAHFTRGLISVLRDLASGELEVDPGLQYVPLATIARAARSAVLRLADENRSYRQYVTASAVDLSSDPPVLPLFDNISPPTDSASPLHTPAIPVLPIPNDLDEALDAWHFVECAAGSAAVRDLGGGLAACFSGRSAQLRSLSRWLNGQSERALSLVTGSPGSGKSALLGVLICAAHPALRQSTEPIWDHADQAPMQVDLLSVVHARQRGISEICAAVGRQLQLGEGSSPDDLLAQLRTLRGQRPVLIIDALDECDDVVAAADWLTRVATLTRPDGSPAVRLLVASRAYEEIQPLQDLARAAIGQEFDLDNVPLETLGDDLYRYVTDLLRSVPRFRTAHKVTGAFAGKLAETAASSRTPGSGDFLVAGIYTRHFISTFRPGQGADVAERLGSLVPRTLPGVLESDLTQRPDHPWLRPVLTALAHARGQGMPASVIARAAATFRPDSPPPSLSEVQSSLRAGRYYLRPSSDTEGVRVFRLFHEALAEHLRNGSNAEGIYPGLLAGVGPPGGRVWAAAEPYLRQHLLEHAGDPAELLDDPGFLLYADPAGYAPLLTEETRWRADSWAAEDPVLTRRAAFALAAAEWGRPDLARRAATMPGEPPLSWLPLWVHGTRDEVCPKAPAPVVAAMDDRGRLHLWGWHESGPKQADLAWPLAPIGDRQITALALGEKDGQLVLIIGTAGGSVQLIGHDGEEVALNQHRSPVRALAIAGYGADSAVLSGSEDRAVLSHLLSSARDLHSPVTIPGAPAQALAAGGHPLTPIVACINSIGELWVWRPEAGSSGLRQWVLQSPARSVVVGSGSDRPIVVAGCADGTVRTWDYETRTALKTVTGHHGPVRAVTIDTVDGRMVVVTGGQDGTVRVWDLLTGRGDGAPRSVCSGPVTAMAVRATPAGLLCLVASTGSISLWNVTTGQLLQEFTLRGAVTVGLDLGRPSQPAPVASDDEIRLTALEVTTGPDGRVLAILGCHTGAVFLLDFCSGQQIREPLEADGHRITSVQLLQLAGTATVAACSDSVTRLWQISSGATAVAPPGEFPIVAGSRQIILDGALVSVRGTETGSVLIDDEPLGAHKVAVTAVTTTYLAGRPTAITGDSDGAVRFWDLRKRILFDELNVRAAVFSIAASTDEEILVGAGGQVFSFQRIIN